MYSYSRVRHGRLGAAGQSRGLCERDRPRKLSGGAGGGPKDGTHAGPDPGGSRGLALKIPCSFLALAVLLKHLLQFGERVLAALSGGQREGCWGFAFEGACVR